MKICKYAKKILRISQEKAEKLLEKILNSVVDFYFITAAHYLNSGEAALTHFCFLIPGQY